jgi:hypothetical protein
LDFETAFDQVDFHYLWTTMEKLGITGKYLALVKGLVTGATAKIHINGIFSTAIPILRGVRQGDPLAPLLFAIYTQPLLAQLDKALTETTDLGVEIQGKRQICHCFFADDVGIFILAEEIAFQKLTELISMYENASGAKLNLQKSIIVPIAMTTNPNWIHSTGCIIAEPNKIIKYLGAPFAKRLT